MCLQVEVQQHDRCHLSLHKSYMTAIHLVPSISEQLAHLARVKALEKDSMLAKSNIAIKADRTLPFVAGVASGSRRTRRERALSGLRVKI